jgi:DNA-binding transcriptional regulator YiaG
MQRSLGWRLQAKPGSVARPQRHSRVAFLPIDVKFERKLRRYSHLESMGFGGQVTLYRVRHKLMQRELAALLGVDTFTIINWEKGRSFPEARHIPKIIELIGVHPRPEPKTQGERLVYERERLGLTQRAYAKLIGRDVATVWRWEKSEKPV